ncbi:hypothetical protein BN1843_28240 [Escherichia coli]|nr:hypothetical protein BN1843_28240 [Escherichia coli]
MLQGPGALVKAVGAERALQEVANPRRALARPAEAWQGLRQGAMGLAGSGNPAAALQGQSAGPCWQREEGLINDQW